MQHLRNIESFIGGIIQIPKALMCILKADSVKHLMKLQMKEAHHSTRLMSSVTFTSMYCERLLRKLNKEMKPLKQTACEDPTSFYEQ